MCRKFTWIFSPVCCYLIGKILLQVVLLLVNSTIFYIQVRYIIIMIIKGQE